MSTESPHFKVPEILWPNEVKPEDLESIDSFRKQGLSLAASVSKVIIEDKEKLIIIINSQLIINSLDSLVNGFVVVGALNTYTIPANVILYAEQIIRDGKLEEKKEPSEDVKEFARQFEQVVEIIHKTQGKKPPDFEAIRIANRASSDITAKALAKVLAKIGPLELIDNYIENELNKISKAKEKDPELCELFKTAIEQGRQRFHQLYKAAQPIEKPQE